MSAFTQRWKQLLLAALVVTPFGLIALSCSNGTDSQVGSATEAVVAACPPNLAAMGLPDPIKSALQSDGNDTCGSGSGSGTGSGSGSGTGSGSTSALINRDLLLGGGLGGHLGKLLCIDLLEGMDNIPYFKCLSLSQKSQLALALAKVGCAGLWNSIQTLLAQGTPGAKSSAEALLSLYNTVCSGN